MRFFAPVLLSLVLVFPLVAQPTPFVTGLQTPTKAIFTHAGNLAVAESGTTAANTGRVSLVDRTSGQRRSLLSGLPSAVDLEDAPSGPSALALQGETLYIVIGAGNGVAEGPLAGTEVPNPNPASPILSSILAVKGSRSLDTTLGGFDLTPADHTALKNGQTLTLQNVIGETLEVRLLVDFPNYVDAPRGDFQFNVRASNPFGIVASGQTLFVVDASQDIVRRVDATTGAYGTHTTFARFNNPTPVGPPVIDAVPDSIRLHGNELYVTLLTGFPFPAGVSEVRRVSVNGVGNERAAAGFTAAIDSYQFAPNRMMVLEFSTNLLQGAPGRLLLFEPNGDRRVLADGLITPTNMVVDQRSGEVFIVHIFTGAISRLSLAGRIPAAAPTAIIPVVSSVAGANGSRFSTSLQISNPYPYPISGQIVIHPAGSEGSATDPSLTYNLRPFETRYYAELVTAAGTSGAGSADVIAAVGGAPVTLVRIAELGSPTNPEVQIPVLPPSSALGAGQHGALLTPPTERYRMNVGVRSLAEGATVTFRLYDASGTLQETVTRTFGPNFFQQFPVSGLFSAFVNTNQTILVTVDAGRAIVYGTSIENSTSAMTLQIATAQE